jgi:hypothetical protein
MASIAFYDRLWVWPDELEEIMVSGGLYHSSWLNCFVLVCGCGVVSARLALVSLYLGVWLV